MEKTRHILHLVLAKRWFDMIASGEKKEEYREITYYWQRRLFPPLSLVTFHCGYSNKTITRTIHGIRTGKGKPEWGAPTDRDVFIIDLGKSPTLQ